MPSEEVVVSFLPVCAEAEMLLFHCVSSHPNTTLVHDHVSLSPVGSRPCV